MRDRKCSQMSEIDDLCTKADYMQGILDVLPDVVFVLDGDGQYLDALTARSRRLRRAGEDARVG